MAAYYFSVYRLELEKGEICYGETLCLEGQGPLAKYAKDEVIPVEKVCGGCRLFKTKQPTCPDYLAEFVELLETLAGRQRLGLTVDSSDFDEMQLAAIDGKAEARAKYDSLEAIQRRKDAATSPGQSQSSLPALLGRPGARRS